MKIISVTCFFSLLAALSGSSQGTFIYDQQDSTTEGTPPYGSFSTMQSYARPWGQSFTPTQTGVDFIRLELVDDDPADSLGAAVYLELMSGSIAGPVIGTTVPVTMPNGYSGPTTFLFPSTVQLTPGVTYFFQPTLQSGGPWDIVASSFQYSGGSEYNDGVTKAGNLWFREGIIVPEPSSVALLLLGGAALALLRRRSPEQPRPAFLTPLPQPAEPRSSGAVPALPNFHLRPEHFRLSTFNLQPRTIGSESCGCCVAADASWEPCAVGGLGRSGTAVGRSQE